MKKSVIAIIFSLVLAPTCEASSHKAPIYKSARKPVIKPKRQVKKESVEPVKKEPAPVTEVHNHYNTGSPLGGIGTAVAAGAAGYMMGAHASANEESEKEVLDNESEQAR